jgi:hypothetical protein
MITVSDEWKALHQKQFLPESFVEITLSVADDTVKQQYSYSWENCSYFGNPGAVVHNKEVLPPAYYTTLEENLWLLDGTRRIIPQGEAVDNPGFVSVAAASASSNFQIEFDEVRTSVTPGLTITWSSEYDEYPVNFFIQAFNGDALVSYAYVTNNTSNVSYVDKDFTGYTKLKIMPTTWSMPNHRARIDQVYFGHLLVFDKSNILSYTHEQTGDPLGGELSKNAIEFDIDNVDGRWDLLNPDSITRYLSEQQSLTVRYGYKIGSNVEWIPAGTFYLSEWKLSDDGMKISFSARDIIGFMMNTQYVYGGVSGVLENSKPIPVYARPEDVYNHVMQGHSVNTIGQLSPGESVTIYDAVYYCPGTDLGLGIYLIDQGWVNGLLCSPVTEATAFPMINDVMSQWDRCEITWDHDDRIEYLSMPLHLEATDVANFIQRNVHKIGGTMWQGSTGVLHLTRPTRNLTDYVISDMWEHSHPSLELSKPLKQIDVLLYSGFMEEAGEEPVVMTTEVGSNGETLVVDNPYVLYLGDDSGDYYIREAYRDWYKHRGMLKGEFRADPRLELFDVISVQSKYGMISPVMVTRIKYTYNGSFHGTFEGKILDPTVVATETEVT